jgi:outer membrane protein TolC
VSANLEVTAAGESFPLTDPGFSVGVDLSFDAPVAPSRTSAQIGKTGPEERSTGFGVTSEPAGDIERLYSAKVARLQAQRGRAELEDLVKNLEFSIRESLLEIRNLKAGLALLREKRELERRRRQIQLVQLDIGEITRLDYLEDEVARARLRIGIANQIVELFNQEIGLLQTAGSSVAGLHVHVLTPLEAPLAPPASPTAEGSR